ncbi:MAG TPA: riboflavin synthase [Pyrinomonadaceae bacterium]|nr:riboflavin synthase [Pyrinomonadaceae bacterium]
MFTGLIEELGTVASVEKLAEGSRIIVSADVVTGDMANGDSVAVNGVCLTALDVTSTSFAADVSPETLLRSTIGRLEVGSRVNLERSVTPTTRLGGHIVQGHVDSRGKFLGAAEHGDFWTVTIGFPPEIAKYLVFKGSVSVEGISLTIAELREDSFDIAVIPKTWEMTSLSTLTAQDDVNLEADVIAKYVERLLEKK